MVDRKWRESEEFKILHVHLPFELDYVRQFLGNADSSDNCFAERVGSWGAYAPTIFNDSEVVSNFSVYETLTSFCAEAEEEAGAFLDTLTSDIYAAFGYFIDELDLHACRYVGRLAFAGFVALREVRCSEELYADDWAFAYCNTLQLTDFSCLYVGVGSFCNCISLERMPRYIGENRIKPYAFWGCEQLVSAESETCTAIGYAAFACSGVESASFPAAYDTDNQIFFGCDLLESIDFGHLRLLGSGTFERCSALVTIDLPSVSRVEYNAFKDSGLRVLNVPVATYIESGGMPSGVVIHAPKSTLQRMV